MEEDTEFKTQNLQSNVNLNLNKITRVKNSVTQCFNLF